MAKKKKNKKNKDSSFKKGNIFSSILNEETKKWLGGILLFLAAIITGLSFFDLAGIGGKMFIRASTFLLGEASPLIPLVFILSGLVFLKTRIRKVCSSIFLAILILVLGICGILASFDSDGGQFGYIISWPLLRVFSPLVAQIIFGAAIIAASLIFWQLFSFSPYLKEEAGKERLITRIIKKIKPCPKFKIQEIPFSLKESEGLINKEEIHTPSLKIETKDITKKSVLTSGYQLPPVNLLELEQGSPISGDIRINSAIIKKTLQNFNISVEMSEVNIGPTVTQYTLKPAEGIKLSKITALSNDISLALASYPIRIEAPIPGRSVVGIEVPNKIRLQVRLRNLIQNPDFQALRYNLGFVLGRDVSGSPLYTGLAYMPHLLVAGATGTGKTIFLNSLILSLIYQNSPENLRFILIDPKRVEFTMYNELPHLLCPVIFDAVKTVNVLKWLIKEMERRFEILSELGSKDINVYNETINRKLAEREKNDSNSASSLYDFEIIPYIVLIIDELADLMAAKGREIEAEIVRLAQMARAVGIHLVVATQRPSVEVITGLIKANITSRISFQVASQIDSRTILDTSGAEKLLGKGDMLFISAENSKPKRIQATYVSEKESKKVINYIKSGLKKMEPKEHEEILENKLTQELKEDLQSQEEKIDIFHTQEDPLYEEAKEIVIKAGKASSSLLQRRLRLGYARAARLIDLLEEKGVIGPAQGAKPREVYVKTDKKEEEDGWQKV